MRDTQRKKTFGWSVHYWGIACTALARFWRLWLNPCNFIDCKYIFLGKHSGLGSCDGYFLAYDLVKKNTRRMRRWDIFSTTLIKVRWLSRMYTYPVLTPNALVVTIHLRLRTHFFNMFVQLQKSTERKNVSSNDFSQTMMKFFLKRKSNYEVKLGLIWWKDNECWLWFPFVSFPTS